MVLRLIQRRVKAKSQKLVARCRDVRGRAAAVAGEGGDDEMCTADKKQNVIDLSTEFTSAEVRSSAEHSSAHHSELLYPSFDARARSSLQ